MKVTRVSVEVRETVSLPGYANVSRGVTITAKIAGFGFEEAHGRIQKQAEKLVHRQIDDVLEEAGEPPKYFDGQRYSPVSCWRTGDSAVVPSGYVALPEGWSTVRTRTGFRSATAERLAMGEVRGNGRYLGVLQDGDCLPRNPIDSKPVDESESDRCDGCGDVLEDLAYCSECYQNQALPPHVYSCRHCQKQVLVGEVACGECRAAGQAAEQKPGSVNVDINVARPQSMGEETR